MKCTWPSEKFALGTQCNLYSIGLCWDFALGVTQILCFGFGVTQILAFLDTNMLVYPKENCGVGGLTQMVLRCGGIYT